MPATRIPSVTPTGTPNWMRPLELPVRRPVPPRHCAERECRPATFRYQCSFRPVPNSPKPRMPTPRMPTKMWWLWLPLLAISVFGLFAGGRHAQVRAILGTASSRRCSTRARSRASSCPAMKSRARSRPHCRTARSPISPPCRCRRTWRASSRSITSSSAPAATDGGALGTLLSWILPPLLFVGIWMFASRAMTGGGGGGMVASAAACCRWGGHVRSWWRRPM